MEVEQVGDAAGDAVAQLARHRVLGDCRREVVEAVAQLGGDRGTDVGRQSAERRRHGELASDLWEGDPQGGLVVLLARHRVAEDDRRAFGVDRAVRPAVVGQGGVGAGDGPLLRVVHHVADLGRDREVPRERRPLPLAHPAADLRVGPLGRLGVGVEVQVRVPPVRLHVADRVAPLLEVVPEGRNVGGVGQDGADADDRDGCGALAHDVLP